MNNEEIPPLNSEERLRVRALLTESAHRKWLRAMLAKTGKLVVSTSAVVAAIILLKDDLTKLLVLIGG